MHSKNTDPGQAKRNPSGRDKGLDFVKGWLVVGMVIYHTACLNERAGDTNYLSVQSIFDFVTGSWIYISGVIIATYYAKSSIVNWWQVSQRLLTRGLKLLVLVLSMNAMLIALGWSKGNLSLSWNSLYTVLIPGTGATSFEILIGISYMLLISPLLLIQKKVGNILALLILLSVPLFYYHNARFNHWAIACGMGGFLIGGVLGTDWFRRLYQPKRNNTLPLLASMSVVALYFTLKLLWNYGKGDIFIYLVGITSILAMLYLCFQWFTQFRSVVYVLELLGRYPLVAYIWQMGVIVYFAAMKSRLGVELPYIIDFSIVMVVLILSIQLLNILISRNTLVNKTYGWLFG